MVDIKINGLDAAVTLTGDMQFETDIGGITANKVTLDQITAYGLDAVATAGYLLSNGSAADLTDFPTFNQDTTGNAATVTTNADMNGPVQSTGNTTRFGSAGEISDYLADINDQTGTTYTIDISADKGKLITQSNASAITTTLSATAPVGFCCTVYQKGAGQITFSPASGASLVNKSSHTKTSGQYAVVTLFVESNAGSAAKWVLAGDTGA